MKDTTLILHGECMIFSSSIPSNVKNIKASNEKYHIVADSEVTGNHHVVDVDSNVSLYESENGTIFMKNEVPTQVRCLVADRHDSVTIEAGTWEFGIQKEYDHINDELIAVRD